MSDPQALDLRPGALPIEAYQGDDFVRDVRVQNAAGTGYALTTAKMQIKTMSGTVMLTLTVGDGLTITNPGTITISIPKADMADLVPTTYKYDMQVTFTSTGKQRTLLAGLFNVTAETTT